MTRTPDPGRPKSARAVLSAAILLLASSPAWAQGLTDLLGRKDGPAAGRAAAGDLDLRLGRGRADLELSPNLRPVLGPDRKTVSVSAQADLRLICGQFDLKASLQHLLGREAREEFLEGILGTLVHELVGSGMELLCQAEPTLCTLLQNHSVSANLKLGYYKDLCQAVESAAEDAQKKATASAVEQCLKEKKDQGLPLDQAVELCQKKPTPLLGFRGETLGELDLGKELGGIFGSMGLSPGARKLADSLSDGTKLGPRSASSDLDPTALPRLFDEAQADYASRLGEAIGRAAGREPIAVTDLRALVPPGAAPLTEDEIRDFSRLSPRDRSVVIGSISSAMAIYEMGDEIRELERAIELLRGAPTVDEAKRALLEDRLGRLRAEKLRLAERFRDQDLVMRAVSAAKSLAGREYARRVDAIEARAGEEGRKRELRNDTRPYGTLPARTAGSPSGAASSSQGCEGCGLEFGFGSYGSPP